MKVRERLKRVSWEGSSFGDWRKKPIEYREEGGMGACMIGIGAMEISMVNSSDL